MQNNGTPIRHDEKSNNVAMSEEEDLFEQKKQQVFARLAQRHEKQKYKSSITDEENEHNNDKEDENSAISKFWNDFNHLSQNESFTIDNVDRNVCIKEAMQNLLNAHMHLLTSYDIRQADEKIKMFENQIQESRNAKMKKKKFSFSSRKSAPVSTSAKKPEVTSNVSSSRTQVSSSQQFVIPDRAKSFCAINDKHFVITAPVYGNDEEKLEIKPDDDIVLSDCENATITMCCVLGAAYLKNLTNCKILLGPIKSSIFIQNCTNCVFALASKQIRIHTSENCDFYVFARSNPIIEHCKNVRFGAYNLHYKGVENQFTMANFDYSTNDMWNEVKDFNWLGSTKSPNWSTIENTLPIRLE